MAPKNFAMAIRGFADTGMRSPAIATNSPRLTYSQSGIGAHGGSKSQRRVKRRKPAQVIARRLASRGFSDHVPEQNGVKHDLEWPAAENPRQPVQQSHARDEAEFIYLRPVLSAGRRNGRIH